MLMMASIQLSFLIIVSGLVISEVVTSINSQTHLQREQIGMSLVRSKRGIVWDFFQKMIITKNLIADQYKDTQETFNNIYNTVNEQFIDLTLPKPAIQPWTQDEILPTTVEEATSSQVTTESYSISRYDVGRILGRNFRGIQRLAKTELNEAINATIYNFNGYKAEVDEQFSNSLTVETKNKVKTNSG